MDIFSGLGNASSSFHLERLTAITEKMIEAKIIMANSTRHNGLEDGSGTVAVSERDEIIGVGEGVETISVIRVIAKVVLMVRDAWMLPKIYDDATLTAEPSTVKEAMV